MTPEQTKEFSTLCKRIPADRDGWCEWQLPKMRGYLMQCCDCGLVHEVEFRVVKATKRKRWGWKDGEIIDDPDYQVQMRMRREWRAK